MWQPFVCDNDFGMSFESRLDSTSLPVPVNYISFTITTAYPFTVRGKSDLACVSSDRMTSKSFLAVLTEVIGTVYENLIIK